MTQTRVDASANTRVDADGNVRVTRSGALLSDETLELLDASVGAAHRDGSSQVVYVLKVSPLSLISRSSEDLYFASTTFRTGAADTPANTLMLGRLIQPNVRVSILKGNSIGRAAATIRGTIKIQNQRESHFDRNIVLTEGRGRYDGLRKEYSWQERTAQMYLGPEDGLFVDSFDAFFPFQVVDFDWSTDQVLLTPGPAAVEADDVVQKNFYGQGYTIGFASPSADEGGQVGDTKGGTKHPPLTIFDDLSGVPLPLSYGRLFGVPAQEISTVNEIHQFHSGSETEGAATVQSLDAVYEDGLAFGAGTGYSEDLESATFRLVSPSDALITCDVHGALDGPSGTYVDRPGAIIQAVLTGPVGLSVVDLATETIGDYDTRFPYECGFYFGAAAVKRKTFLEAMLAPLGFFYRSRDGRFRVGWVKHPAEETVDLALEEKVIKGVSRKATLRPAWRVRIGYEPVERPVGLQSFAGAVTQSEIARQSNEYRWVEALDEGILDLHKAGEMEIPTRFIQRADAQALADECLKLYGRQRDILEVKLNHKWLRYDIGDIVSLQWPRYDIVDDGDILLESGDSLLMETADTLIKEEDAAGTNYMVVGYVDNPSANDFSVTLWG